MTINRIVPRPKAGRRAPATPPSAPDRLEIVIDETAPSAGERVPGTRLRPGCGTAPGCPHARSMPWSDLVGLLADDRLAVLRRLRSDPARASGTEQTAALEWAGLVRTGADGRPAVPYREIVVRIPL